jgi:hypothetical protein
MKTKLLSLTICASLFCTIPTNSNATIDKNQIALIGGLGGAGISAVVLYLCYKKSKQITKLIDHDYRALSLQADEEYSERLRKKRKWYRLGMGVSGIAIPLCLIVAAIGARNCGSSGSGTNEFDGKKTSYELLLDDDEFKIYFEKGTIHIHDKTNNQNKSIPYTEIKQLMHNVDLMTTNQTYINWEYLLTFYDDAEKMRKKIAQPTNLKEKIICREDDFKNGFNKIKGKLSPQQQNNDNIEKPSKFEELVVALNYDAVKDSQWRISKFLKGAWPNEQLPKEDDKGEN